MEENSNLTWDFNASAAQNDSFLGEFDGNQYILPWWKQLIWTILFGGMVIVATGGNLIVIWIVLAHKRMRTVTNYFLVNLAVADAMVSSLNVTFNYTYMLNSDWPFGMLYCKICQFISALSIVASVFTLMAISVDRYMAIMYPLKPRMGRRMTLCVAISIWIMGFAISMPNLLFFTTFVQEFPNGDTRVICYAEWPDGPSTASEQEHVYNVVFMVTTYFIPIGSMCFTYVRVGIELWGSQSIGECTQRQLENIKSKRRRCVIYNIMWVPAGSEPQTIQQLVGFLYPADHFLQHFPQLRKFRVNSPQGRTPDETTSSINPIFSTLRRLLSITRVLELFSWRAQPTRTLYTNSVYSVPSVLVEQNNLVRWSYIPGFPVVEVPVMKVLRQVVKMMIVVVSIFAVCWLPFHLYFIITSHFPEINEMPYIQDLYLAIYWLAMSNSMYNPIIYCWMNMRFRRGFKQFFAWCPGVHVPPEGLMRREVVTSRYNNYSGSGSPESHYRIVRNGTMHRNANRNFNDSGMTTISGNFAYHSNFRTRKRWKNPDQS